MGCSRDTVSDSFHHWRSSADPGLPLPGPADHALLGLSRGPVPGLSRAPVTPHRSCTPRARRELRRSRPLEHRHSGCTGATVSSGDSDTPPGHLGHSQPRADKLNPAGPQTRRQALPLGPGARIRDPSPNHPRAYRQRTNPNYTGTRAQCRDSDHSTDQSMNFKNRTFCGLGQPLGCVHELF